MKNIFRILAAIVIVLSIMLFSSCTDLGKIADEPTVPPDTLASFSSNISPIFFSNCPCHIGGPSGGLRLDSYASLMQGGDLGLVVLPNNPDSSIIIQKLEGTRQPQMPFGGTPLPQTTIDLIRRWIAQGAHNN